MKPSRALTSLACVLAAACTDIETAPNVAVSLEFEALPYPSVVAGDTLRDVNGLAAPLRAAAFNSDNERIADAPLRYATLESLISVDSVSGIVVAGTAADTTARVIALAGGLQSTPVRLSVVSRPDSVSRFGTIDTLRYSVTDTTRNVSGDLSVRVVHRRATGDIPVRDWIVTFALQTPADTARAHLVGDNGRRSQTDTTSTNGVASRRIRLSPAGLASARDSVVVLATVRHRGVHVRGSPVRLSLPVQPRVP